MIEWPGGLAAQVTMVDACTRHGRGGSPTAVLMDDAALTDADRRAIVAQAGASHAAFIDADGDVDNGTDAASETAPSIRFFTTQGELVNCGHGTIAAQAVLLDRQGPERYRGEQCTGGRTFGATALRRPDGIEVWFDQGIVELQDHPAAGNDGILAALGIGPDDLAADGDLCVASPGTQRLLVPVGESTLLSMKPDFDRLAAECRRLGYLGCFVYALSPTRKTAVARMFAPAIGVNEDVVNANSSGCLAAYLLGEGRDLSIEVHQGITLDRPSAVFASATATDQGLFTRIGGIAVVRPR